MGPATPAGGTLNLAWQDCGDADTHAKISGFTPTTITLGQKTTLTAVSTLDKDISDGAFDVTLKGMGMKLMDCKGDISTTKTCNFPLGSGSITFDGFNLPAKAGSPMETKTELLVNSMSGTSSTTTITNATTKSGDKIFCLQVVSSTSDSPEANNVNADLMV